MFGYSILIKEVPERKMAVNRRTSALCCLLLTAALLCALPSLWITLTSGDSERMAERLRPQKSQILTVWILSDQTEGKKHLNEQIARFEKENPGMRVYLRRADVSELFAADAVLPDAIVFSPGVLTEPWRVLTPIGSLSGVETLRADTLLAGRSRSVQYAVPLWLAPSVLTVPAEFFPQEVAPTPKPTQTSFFDLSTPMPTQDPTDTSEAGTSGLPDASLIPWEKLLASEAMSRPEGTALIQLLSMCPEAMRPAMIDSLMQQGQAPTATQTPTKTAAKSAPKETQSSPARVLTLAAYTEAIARGEALVGFAMTPACTQKVLLMGLCRNHALSCDFLAFFLGEEAQAGASRYGLLPVTKVAISGDEMTSRLKESYENGLLIPNAFEHTSEEMQALCLDAFRRNQSPVETLLRLR